MKANIKVFFLINKNVIYVKKWKVKTFFLKVKEINSEVNLNVADQSFRKGNKAIL